MQRFNETHQVPIENYTSKTSRRYRQADVRADLVVPLGMSLVTGVLLALGGAVAWWEWNLPSWLIAVGFFVGFGAVWAWRLNVYDSLLTAAEEIAQRDINGDGKIGKPQPEATKTYVTKLEIVKEKTNGQVEFIRRLELPVKDAVLAQFAQAALADRPLTERAWAGDGRPMSSDEYRVVKHKLLSAGLLEWGVNANGKRSVIASEKGRRVFGDFISQYQQGGE